MNNVNIKILSTLKQELALMEAHVSILQERCHKLREMLGRIDAPASTTRRKKSLPVPTETINRILARREQRRIKAR